MSWHLCVCVFFFPLLVRTTYCECNTCQLLFSFFFFLTRVTSLFFIPKSVPLPFFFFLILLFIYTLQYPSPSPNHTTPQHHENAVVVVTPAAIQFTSLISLRTFSK